MAAGATAQQLRTMDRAAVDDYGIPLLLLMEHAGMAVAHAIQARAPHTARIICLVGRGHNGGDGLAAMRLLHAAGYQPAVCLLGRRDQLHDEPALYARMLDRLSIPMHELVHESSWQSCATAMSSADWIVDAVLGTGLRGAPQSDAVRAIQLMNDTPRPVLAVDTPSGLHVDTGTIDAVAVRATVTVTFGKPKQGFFQGQGPAHVGELLVDAITFPPALLATP